MNRRVVLTSKTDVFSSVAALPHARSSLRSSLTPRSSLRSSLTPRSSLRSSLDVHHPPRNPPPPDTHYLLWSRSSDLWSGKASIQHSLRHRLRHRYVPARGCQQVSYVASITAHIEYTDVTTGRTESIFIGAPGYAFRLMNHKKRYLSFLCLLILVVRRGSYLRF